MTTTHDALIPDLTTYRTIHRVLREAAHHMAAAAASDATSPERAAALVRYWKGYAGEVLAHHTVEDTIVFPALVERVPVAAELIVRTDDEHDHLDHLMEALHAATAAWAAGTGGAPVALFRELARHMDDHLGFEDEDILPLIERHFSAVEYEELDQAAAKSLGVGKQAAFTVPFVMYWVDDVTREHLLATAPMPLRVLYRVFRRGHARLASAAFGDAA